MISVQIELYSILGLQNILKEKIFRRFVVLRHVERCGGEGGHAICTVYFLLLYCVVCKVDKLLK